MAHDAGALPEYCTPVMAISEHAQLHQNSWGKPLNAQSFSLEADGVTVEHHYLTDAHLLPNEVAAVTGSRLLILSEYSSLYDTILKVHQHLPSAGVLIHGNSGIGKSFSLDYLRRRLLEAKIPFLFFRNSTYHLYTQHGVHAIMFPERIYQPFSSPIFDNLVTLVDSPSAIEPPPNVLTESRLFICHATSPQPVRYRWAKARMCTQHFVMDPSSVSEIHAMFFLHDSAILPPPTLNEVKDLVSMFGMNFRDLYRHACDFRIRGNMDGGIYTIDTAINNATIDSIQRLSQCDALTITTRHRLSPPAISLTYPQQTSPYPPSHFMKHSIASHYIWKRIWDQFARNPLNDMRSFYDQMSGSSLTYTTRRWLFESWAHTILAEGGTFSLTGMVIDSVGGHREKGTQIEEVALASRTSVLYGAAEGSDATKSPTSYYIPSEGNNPTFDSFLRFDDVGIGFRMTIANEHSLAPAGLTLLRRRFKGVSRKLFVFVIPRGHSFKCPANAGRDFEFFTLEIDVGAYASKFDIPVGESDEERDLEMYTSPTDGDVLNDAAEFSIEL